MVVYNERFNEHITHMVFVKHLRKASQTPPAQLCTSQHNLFSKETRNLLTAFFLTRRLLRTRFNIASSASRFRSRL